jgi:uncharacterized protein YneF (UPF0154 family)
MIAMDITLKLVTLIMMITGSFAFGFLLQRRQIAKQKMRVAKLSKEMVDNHAEILELQKEFVALQKGEKPSRTPVLALTTKFEAAVGK